MVALKAMRRKPLDFARKHGPDVFGNDDETACHLLARTCMSDASLRARRHTFQPAVRFNLDEFRLLQRLLRVAMMRWSRGE